jgi:hypothetical protein
MSISFSSSISCRNWSPKYSVLVLDKRGVPPPLNSDPFRTMGSRTPIRTSVGSSQGLVESWFDSRRVMIRFFLRFLREKEDDSRSAGSSQRRGSRTPIRSSVGSSQGLVESWTDSFVDYCGRARRIDSEVKESFQTRPFLVFLGGL